MIGLPLENRDHARAARTLLARGRQIDAAGPEHVEDRLARSHLEGEGRASQRDLERRGVVDPVSSRARVRPSSGSSSSGGFTSNPSGISMGGWKAIRASLRNIRLLL